MRTAIAITALLANSGIAQAAPAVDPANGHTIDAEGDTDRLFLHVKNTAGAAKNVTVKAGDSPPAFRSGLGDLVVQVPAASERLIGPFESARFAQADGSLEVDLEAAITGTIAVYRLPRVV